MGGLGSGRREYATTPTVSECWFLDSDRFTDAVEHPGRGGPVRWGDPDDPTATITVVMLSDEHMTSLKNGEALEATPVEAADADIVTLDDSDQNPDSGQDGETDRATAVYLTYSITDPRADKTRDVSYYVPLEYTECNFGGVRPWFRCPGPVDGGACGRRVGKLYRPPRGDLYLCRECYDLGYRSSRKSGNEIKRAEQRYRKAFAKADAENRQPHPNNSPFFPDRPKGMHRETFEDLTADVRAAREEWDHAYSEKLQDMRKHLETTLEGLG